MSVPTLTPFLTTNLAPQATAATTGISFFPILGWGLLGAAFLYQELNPPKIESGKLKDFTFRGSEYGIFIPKIWGKMRVESNTTWLDFHPESGEPYENVVKDRNLFGQVVSKFYEYRASWMSALADGEMKAVVRIWLNNELFFDQSGNDWKSFVESKKLLEAKSDNQNEIRIYLGSETQMPDSYMEFIEGIGNVSAYRGTCYVLFKNILLTYDYGNQIPSVSADVSSNGYWKRNSWEALPIDHKDLTVSTFNPQLYIDNNGLHIVLEDNSGKYIGEYLSKYGIKWIIFLNGVPQRIPSVAPSPYNYLLQGYAVAEFTGQPDYYIAYGGNPASSEVSTITHNTGVLDVINSNGGAGKRIYSSLVNYSGQIYLIGGKEVDGTPNKHNGCWVFDGTDTFNEVTSDITGFGDIAAQVLKSLVWLNKVTSIVRIVADDTFLIFQSDNPGIETTWKIYYDYTFTISGISGNTFIVDGDQRSYINNPGKLWVYGSTGNDDSGNNDKGYTISNVSYNTSNDTTIITVNETIPSITADGSIYHYPLVNNLSATGFDRDHIPGAVVFMDELFVAGGTPENRIVKTRTTFISPEVSIKTIVDDITTDIGFASNEINSTELGNDTLTGHSITEIITARELLLPLQRVSYSDIVIYDGIINFHKRGRTPISIDSDDIGWENFGNNNSNHFNIVKNSVLELPKTVEISYYDVARDYQKNTQRSSRIISKSKSIKSVDLPVALDKDKAAQIAEVLLWDSYAERDQYEFTLPYEYLYLIPSDIISVTIDSISYRLRITEITRDGILLKCKAVPEMIEIYDRPVIGDSGGDASTGTKFRADSYIALIDIPYIPSLDPTDSYGFYFAAAPTNHDWLWPGAMLLEQKLDNGYYSTIAFANKAATIGNTSTVLGSGTTVGIDYASNVTVYMSNGTIETVTQDEFMNGKNLVLVGNEIISVWKVVSLGNNVYKFFHLLRGLYGTEWAVGNHSELELVVLLDDSLVKVIQGIEDHGRQYNYKGNTIGKAPGESFSFTNYNICHKPYSPVHITGHRLSTEQNINGYYYGIGSWRIEWMRRPRGAGVFFNIPARLNEEQEKYEIDFINNGEVLHTQEVSINTLIQWKKPYFILPANGFNWIDAEGNINHQYGQNEIYGGIQSSIEVNIYQISATIGRGYAGNAILSI